MRSLLAGVLCCSILAGMSGCKNDNVVLDKNSTVPYDPAKDGEPKDIGPSKGGKGKSKIPGSGSPS